MHGQAPLALRQLELARGIRGDDILLRQPLEKRPDADEPHRLVVKRQGLAVLFSVVKEVSLVVLEDALRYPRRPSDPPGVEPLDEAQDMQLPVLERPLRKIPDAEPLEVTLRPDVEPFRIVRVADWLSTFFLIAVVPRHQFAPLARAPAAASATKEASPSSTTTTPPFFLVPRRAFPFAPTVLLNS